MLTLGSMFAGIGGIELGFESTGRFKTKWQIERDKYANQVLAKHWPSVDRWKDVKTFPPRPVSDWGCDVIAGGFPCQDLSFAGKGAGLAGKRSGLFYEVIRVAGIIRPRAIVLENVAALYVRGLDVVLGDLAQIGYNAEWHCVSAASVGAPHRRDRVFIIGSKICDAYGNGKPTSTFNAKTSKLQGDLADSISTRAGNKDGTTCRQKRKAINALKPATLRQGNGQTLSKGTDASSADCNIVADSDSKRGCSRDAPRQDAKDARQSSRRSEHWGWHSEPAVGRVAHGVSRRVDRLKCLGNAVVPQCAAIVANRVVEILDEQNAKPDL